MGGVQRRRGVRGAGLQGVRRRQREPAGRSLGDEQAQQRGRTLGKHTHLLLRAAGDHVTEFVRRIYKNKELLASQMSSNVLKGLNILVRLEGIRSRVARTLKLFKTC